jgi:endoglucanase
LRIISTFIENKLLLSTLHNCNQQMKKLLFLYLFIFGTVATRAQPYVLLPGKIEAENFTNQNGANTENTEDAGGGLNIGWLSDGSWMDYNISIPAAGKYTFRLRVANGFSDNAEVHIKSGSNVLASRIVPRTGGMQGWQTVSMFVSLPAGNQTIRIHAQKGLFSFNWFECVIPKPLSGRIEAEAFDVASDVRTESTEDIGGGINVNYIDDEDWMDYHVNVASSGIHTFNFRVANSYGNGIIEIKNENGDVLGQVDVPRTGGWQNFTTITTTANLTAGDQILRIFTKKGTFNFNWFEVDEGGLAAEPEVSVISFSEFPLYTVGDNSFNLSATSNNTETPITFSSSNPAVVSLANVNGTWVATIVSAGSSVITASQEGSPAFINAENVTRTITVQNASAPSTAQKIVIDPKRWYQLTNATSGLDPMFDGETQVSFHTGWGKVLSEYEAYYPLLDGEQISIESVKFFDLEGSTVDNPAVLSVINSQWQRIPIATFTGEIYNGWVGPYPDRNISGDAQFRLDSIISDIRYLVWDVRGIMPTEMEIYGTYTPATQQNTPVPAKSVRLGDMFGVNGYEWNFQHGNTPWQNDESMVSVAKSFTGVRHYLDWEKLESNEGEYSYNPTMAGGWHLDLMYERCKQENIDVLTCIKTQPTWMQNTYPVGEREGEFVPVRYGKDFAAPVSYIEQAKLAFQFTARYGRNTSVDPSLLSVHNTPRWPGDNPNTVKIGLDLVKYLECDNERDKWWKGRMGYQTAREYAANLSAFYDGHKNTMGIGVGVKNADPTMQVVIAGLVTGPDYVKGMVDWCKEYRGYNADGTVNLCWDVINFHLYTDNTSSSQSGTSTRGMSAEMTPANIIVEDFVKVAHDICYDMPVWITETGFDVHQDSPIKAIPIGNKSALETQGDWILRTSLFSARKGIDKVYFYQMYDDNSGGGMFGSSGLLNSNQTRRPAADYMFQINKLFGNYRYKETTNNDPIVDRYELDGNSLYILTVPDEIGRTVSHSLNLPGAGMAQIYRPVVGSDNMSLEEVPVVDGKITVTATETPMFVTAAGASNARKAASLAVTPSLAIAEEVAPLHKTVEVYPNPAVDHITIDLANDSSNDIEMKIFDARAGRLYKQETISKPENLLMKKINISSLPTGVYVIEVKQGNERAFRKIVKGH